MKIIKRKLPNGIAMRIEIKESLPPIATFTAHIASERDLSFDKKELEDHGIEVEKIEESKTCHDLLIKALEKLGEKWRQYKLYFDSPIFKLNELKDFGYEIERELKEILSESNPDTKILVEVKKARKRSRRKIIDVSEKELLERLRRK